MLHWFRRIKKQRKREQCLPVPSLTLPYNQCVRKQRRRFLISFLILLAMSVFYTVYNANRRIAREELIHVWVAKTAIQAPATIEEAHLLSRYFSQKNLPDGYFETKENMVDKVIIQDVVKNEILLTHHFSERIDTSSVSTKFQKSFALTMDENWFEAKFPTLAPHDTVDILTTNPKAGLKQTIPVAQNLPIIEMQYESKNDKKTLVVNLTQDEARAILFARGARLPMHIIVHSSLSQDTNESR